MFINMEVDAGMSFSWLSGRAAKSYLTTDGVLSRSLNEQPPCL